MVITVGIMSLLPSVCAQLGSINPGYVTPVTTMESGYSELSSDLPLNGSWMFKAEAEQMHGGPGIHGHPRTGPACSQGETRGERDGSRECRAR